MVLRTSLIMASTFCIVFLFVMSCTLFRPSEILCIPSHIILMSSSGKKQTCWLHVCWFPKKYRENNGKNKVKDKKKKALCALTDGLTEPSISFSNCFSFSFFLLLKNHTSLLTHKDMIKLLHMDKLFRFVDLGFSFYFCFKRHHSPLRWEHLILQP